MERPSHLVVYYSRSGTTRKLAEALATALHADLEELIDRRNRRGPLGFLRSIIDAKKKQPAAIAPPANDPTAYRCVVVGTPVWAGSPSAAVRAYLLEYGDRLGHAAFFCTLGGSGSEQTFAEMERLIGTAPVARFAATRTEVASSTHIERLDDFVRQLQTEVPAPHSTAAKAA